MRTKLYGECVCVCVGVGVCVWESVDFNIWSYIVLLCGALHKCAMRVLIYSFIFFNALYLSLSHFNPLFIFLFLSRLVFLFLSMGGGGEVNTYFFLFLLTALRGGVIGRVPCMLPYWNLRFSAGFKIWNEHISESSTDIIAPAWKKHTLLLLLLQFIKG